MLLSRKKPFYKKKPLRFHCTGCGKCCHGNPRSHYIEVSDAELERIRHYMEISRKWFLRRYTEILPWGNRGIRLNDDGTCPFLGDNRCSIYALRPNQCRSYPFWPELVDTKNNWLSENKRCEGFNQGSIVPIEQIEKQLRQSGNGTLP